MGRVRSLAAQSPAIVISMIALMFSLGTGAYAASMLNGSQIAPGTIPGNRIVSHSVGARQLAPASIRFHALSLRNNWKSSQGQYGTGNPSYAVSNGVVYLSGSLHQSVSGSNIVAFLPRGARPRHNMYILVYGNSETTATLYIEKSGLMRAYGGAAKLFTSLATVSFPIGS